MAMLAEPRRKQKWTLNPRGKQWSDDSSKFGQKMLEKMGWTCGKGLGANEQGMTEHVRVKYKDDQAGIGFSKSNQDKLWTEQQDGFNTLLQELQTVNDPTIIKGSIEKNDDTRGQSLEVKSKHSRARVHYQKFTRGKDVNKYSTKDLANIFGQKDLNDKINSNINVCKSVDKQLNRISTEDVTGGIVTVTSGTINDYFKNKMPLMPMLERKYDNNDAKECISESDNEQYMGFGFSHSNNELPSDNIEMNNHSFINSALDINDCEVNNRKRKNDIYVDSSLIKDNNYDDNQMSKKLKITKNFAFDNSALDLSSSDNLRSIKNNEMEHLTLSKSIFTSKQQLNHDKNDRKKNGIVGSFKSSEMSVIGRENVALDITDEINNRKHVTFNDIIEYNTDVESVNKKKRKKKQKKNKLDKYEVALDESMKNKLSNITLKCEKNSFINEGLDVEIINEESVDNEMNERKKNKRKRKKIRPLLNLDTIEEEDVIEIDNKITDSNLHDCSISVKKQNQHDNNVMKSSLELNTEINTMETDESNEISILNVNKMNKKKRKKEKKIEVTNDNDNENKYNNEANLTNIQDNVDDINGKRGKKKKRKREQEIKIIDENLNVNVANEQMNIDNNVGVADKKLEKYKMSKPKKNFKTLFTHSPIVHFIGSNINELKGYGVNS